MLPLSGTVGIYTIIIAAAGLMYVQCCDTFQCWLRLHMLGLLGRIMCSSIISSTAIHYIMVQLTSKFTIALVFSHGTQKKTRNFLSSTRAVKCM